MANSAINTNNINPINQNNVPQVKSNDIIDGHDIRMQRSRSVDSALDARSPNSRYNLRTSLTHDVIMEGGSSGDEEMEDAGAARVREAPQRKKVSTARGASKAKVTKSNKSAAATTGGVKGRRKLRQDSDDLDYQP